MPTYPNEPWPSDAAIEALDGTTDAATGLPYVAKGVGPTSTPSYEVQYNRREQRLVRMLAAVNQGRVVEEGSLTVGVYPIDFTIGGAHKSFGGATGQAVPDDATTYFWLDSTPALQSGGAYPGDLTTFLPLAKVVSAGGAMSITDERPKAMFSASGGGGASATGTTSATFQLDSDAGGPLLKRPTGLQRIEIRDSSDTAYAVLRAGTVEATDAFVLDGNPLAASDLTQDGTGTVSSTFDLDSDANGPRLKNVTGALHVRDSLDSVFAPLAAGAIQYQRTLAAHTSNGNVATAESGIVHHNDGATGLVTLSLAATATGVEFTFAVYESGQTLRIDPAAGDQFHDGNSAKGDGKYVESSETGAVLTVLRMPDGDWLIVNKRGTWTFET